jgi:hypothetical protein
MGDVMAPVVRALRLTASADLTLARQRIDALHRELCVLAPWPALRRDSGTVTPTAGVVTLTGLGVVGVTLYASHTPFWYVDRGEVGATDLTGRRLWALAATPVPATSRMAGTSTSL